MQIKSLELVESGPTKIQDAATLTRSLQYTSESVCACTVYIRHVTYTFCTWYINTRTGFYLEPLSSQTYHANHAWPERRAEHVEKHLQDTSQHANVFWQQWWVGVVGVLWTFWKTPMHLYASLKSLWYPNLELFIVIENIGVDWLHTVYFSTCLVCLKIPSTVSCILPEYHHYHHHVPPPPRRRHH